MDAAFTEYFIARWKNYFAKADLPICYFYTDQVGDEEWKETTVENRCLIGNLARVREGFPFVYDARTSGCSGGKRYSGLTKTLRPKFEYFLSCGIPGELEGERYKKSPELVIEYLKNHPPFEAPGKYLIFKRLDRLAPHEQPFAVVFFAKPDVLAGLFALANYDLVEAGGVITPMGSGCASIINYPYLEAASEHPRCVLGMFDVSARPCVPENELTFTVPFQRFKQMVVNMDESFLITPSWNAVKNRF
jgi:uncharacterized protein (DUF169 family)